MLKLINKIAANDAKNLSFWSNFSSPLAKKLCGPSSTKMSESCTITATTQPCASNPAASLVESTSAVLQADDDVDDSVGGDKSTPKVKKRN